MIFFWIAAYGVVHLAGKCMPEGIAAALLFLYALLFVRWTVRTGSCRLAGREKLRGSALCSPFCILPLLVMPACNLFFCRPAIPDGAELLLMLGVALTEELFFRGYLLSFLEKKGSRFAVLATSLLFALLHGLNAGDRTYTLLQMVCAFAVSTCWCCITLRCCSIWPAVAAHFLVNITGTGAMADSRQYFGMILCALTCFFCGMHILPDRESGKKETLV